MRKSKKIVTVLMSAALICSMAVPAGSIKKVYAAEEAPASENSEKSGAKGDAKAASEIPKINLTFGENQETPQYKAGAAGQSLIINVNNLGTAEAKNITVKVKDKSDWPFTASQLNYTGRIERLAAAGDPDGADAAVIKFENLTVKEDVATANHSIKLEVTYEDDTNQYKIPKVALFVSTVAAEKPADPAPDPTPDPDNGGDIGDGGGDMGGVDFGGGGGGVSNGDVTGGSGSASVPRVIVTGFNTEPAEVRAGSDFKLIIHLKNTSKSTAVQNMLFDLEAPTEGTDAATTSPAFLPASGSNSIYLDKIAKDGTQDIAIVLNAKSDLVQKPYSINIGMKYENSDAAQFESSASVSIPVKQDARFEFSEFELSAESIEVGSEVNVMCSLYNLGRTKLYNVKANFEGEGIKGKEQFLGNVESGATANIDGMLTGEAETTGDGTVKMVLSYEDEEGKVMTTEKTFTMFVTPPVIENMGMAVAEPMDAEKKFPVIPFVIGGVVVVGIAAAVVIVKKKKKHKLEQEEADLVDEFDRLTEDE